MSRSQFILGIALLVVSATLAFTISFRSEENSSSEPSDLAAQENDSSRPGRVIQNRTGSSSGTTPRKDRTYYEVTVSDRSLASVAAVVEEESLQQLEALTDRYNLTTSQRRGIFPLIASRHPDYQDGLVINGSSVPATGSTTSLETAMYPLLNDEQQEELEDDILAKDEWWSEIISQLRNDLDQAISTGDILIVPEDGPAPPVNNGTPAPGNGETVENPDIDFTNLFKT